MASVETLKGIGGSEWKTDDGQKHRVYFSLADLLGIRIDTHESGGICYVNRNGEDIPNGQAGRYLTGKVWVDMTDGRICTQYAESNPLINEAVEALRTRIAEAEDL